MKDQSKTKQSLIQELASLREKIAELEKSEAARKTLDEILRESDDLFRNYLEYAPDGVYMSDLKGTFLYGNRKCEEIIGYRREELIGKNFLELNLLTEKNLAKAIELLQINMAGNPTGPDEIELISKEGCIIPVEINTSLIQLMGQEIILAFVRNITERKHVEKKLRESEANYRQLFVNSPAAIYQVDFKSGKYLKANDLICEYSGCSQEEITSLSPYDLLTEESKKLFLERLEKMGQGVKVPEAVEYEVIDKKGKRWFLQLHTKHIYDAEGHVVAADVVAHDITERKQAEEMLKESENKYRLLAENMRDVIFVMDMNLNYTYLSPSVKLLRGYEPEEAMKHTLAETMTPSSMDFAINALSEIMEMEKSELRDINISRTLQLEMSRKDGTTVWVETTAYFIRDENQRPVGIMGLTRNITERKEAEEQLYQTLDRLRKAIGTTIQVLISAVESRDSYTAGHQSRSANLACAIASEMGLAQEKIEGIRMASSIHDIGKLSIPAEILSKPTKLTNLEFSLIKEHCRIGYEMLKDVESSWPLAEIVHQHHERMNGSGYPRNLKRDDILIEARIMAVADVMEAMASHRPYRAALGIEAALEEIEKNKGILYDNTVADACLQLFREKGYQLI